MSNFMKKMKPMKSPKKLSITNEVDEVKIEESAGEEKNKIEEIVSEVGDVKNDAVSVEENKIEEVVETLEPEEKKESKPKRTRKKTTTKKESKETVELKQYRESDKAAINESEKIMANIIMPKDETWDEERSQIEGEISEIIIDEDMDPTTIKTMLAKLSELSAKVNIRYKEYSSALENTKEEIERVKALNAIGDSADERKRNSMIAVSNYIKEDSDIPVDLLQLKKHYREKKEYYEGTKEYLEYNKGLLILFASANKTELGKAY